MRSKISIAIITFNEEKNILRTLESISWADEIVIVDSGSTDNTVSICRRYTDKVFYHEWRGYTEQKNFAIEQSSCEWILSLDADESVEPALASEIISIISAPESFNGYWIPRKTFFLGRWMRHGGWYPDYNLRLFRKGKGRFVKRAVHEALHVEGKHGRTKHALEHHTYPNIASYIDKMNKYSTLAVEVMAESGISKFKTSLFNIVLRPAFTFIFRYFFRLGFLDGKSGLLLNVLYSYYVFAKYVKAWEYQLKDENEHPIRKQF